VGGECELRAFRACWVECLDLRGSSRMNEKLHEHVHKLCYGDQLGADEMGVACNT
jgi:hypothetical protein